MDSRSSSSASDPNWVDSDLELAGLGSGREIARIGSILEMTYFDSGHEVAWGGSAAEMNEIGSGHEVGQLDPVRKAASGARRVVSRPQAYPSSSPAPGFAP